MPYRKVAADSALRWLTAALRTVFGNPAAFLSMGLLIAVIASLPLLGALLLAVFGPALYAGIAFAAAEQRAGRNAELQHLFRGFTEPGKLPRLLLLCLPGIAAGFIVVLLLVLLLGDAIAAGGGTLAEDPEALAAALGPGALLFVLAALLIGIGAYAMVFFALPRVLLTDVPAALAMRESLRACLTNLGAFLLFFALLLVGAITLSLLLSWLPPMVAQLIATALMIPVVSVALYFAWLDVFAGGAEPSRSTPPPPSMLA